METYVIICKIDSQWEFAVPQGTETGVSCVSLEGWDGEGDGGEVQEGRVICTPIADSS